MQLSYCHLIQAQVSIDYNKNKWLYQQKNCRENAIFFSLSRNFYFKNSKKIAQLNKNKL